jgi:septal ring-binding cell division protein DamX
MSTTPVPAVADATVDNATTAGTTTSPATVTPAKTIYHTMKEPPIPTGKYSPKDAMEDIPRAQYAINLFMASAMVESQEYIRKADPKMYVHSVRAA